MSPGTEPPPRGCTSPRAVAPPLCSRGFSVRRSIQSTSLWPFPMVSGEKAVLISASRSQTLHASLRASLGSICSVGFSGSSRAPSRPGMQQEGPLKGFMLVVCFDDTSCLLRKTSDARGFELWCGRMEYFFHSSLSVSTGTMYLRFTG